MKFISSLFIFFIICTGAEAKAFSYPDIRSSSRVVEDFIPEGWSVLDSVSGDLNLDGLTDKALVIEFDDSVKEARPDGLTRFNHPRILLVLTLNPGGKYTLSVQDNSFLYRTGEGGMKYGDPFEKLQLEDGVLSLRFLRNRGEITYDFEFDEDELLLIGATNSMVSAAGSIEEWDFDFVSHRAVHTLGTIDEKDIYEVYTDIPGAQLKTLDDLKMPLLWEVFEKVFI
ncbi:MAG: hypothetical protein ACHQRM_09100 [Bacteroidia bacterium]